MRSVAFEKRGHLWEASFLCLVLLHICLLLGHGVVLTEEDLMDVIPKMGAAFECANPSSRLGTR